MMDLQKIINNEIIAERAEKMKISPQLTVGEMVLKLENITNKDKDIVLDFDDTKPTGLGSWRGSYCELAINFDKTTTHSVKTFLEELKNAIGKTFHGYKGGDFVMGKTTPVWVANYGSDEVESYKGASGTVGVIDIKNEESEVIIVTDKIDY